MFKRAVTIACYSVVGAINCQNDDENCVVSAGE